MITGKYMKGLRETAGITQTELAKLAGISQAHIAKIETEKVNPRLSTVNALLTILNQREKKTVCIDVMSRKIIPIKPDDTAKKAVQFMKGFNISQLPVMSRGTVVGSVSERTIIHHIDKNPSFLKISEIMENPFPLVNEDDSIEMLTDLLDFHPAILVSRKGKVTGIITKADLLSAK